MQLFFLFDTEYREIGKRICQTKTKKATDAAGHREYADTHPCKNTLHDWRTAAPATLWKKHLETAGFKKKEKVCTLAPGFFSSFMSCRCDNVAFCFELVF